MFRHVCILTASMLVKKPVIMVGMVVVGYAVQ